MRSPIDLSLADLHRRFAARREGSVATYIPELATADPDAFGICLATLDGHVYEVGDSRHPFTIQSVSKPFVYGLALQDRGRDAVLEKIGTEPTGDAFNSIRLASGSGCPLNPMVNAGAIAAASLVAGHSEEDRWDRVLLALSLFAGRTLTLDEKVYVSERDTGHRNRAIAHMLRNSGVIGDDPEPALDRYFRQCSVLVTCRDLSIMAATLANAGVNPLTGERVLAPRVVQDVLSVMTTCGMYDYAGEWMFRVGLPAKSGVSGGILAVLPGRLGIAVFSPPLDAHGNSVRGIAVCHEISRDLGLHFLAAPPEPSTAIRLACSARDLASKRGRSASERSILAACGDRVRIFELQGDLDFPAVEIVSRRIADTAGDLQLALLDLRRVGRIAEVAARTLRDIAKQLGAGGRRLVVSGAQRHTQLIRTLEEAATETDRAVVFEDLDLALEFCEDRLLRDRAADPRDAGCLPLEGFALCQGLSSADLRLLEGLLTRHVFAEGSRIIAAGESADRIYLLGRGEVSITLDLPSGRRTRLATLTPGTCFGELAIVNRGPRTADVHADSEVECFELPLAEFDRLAETRPVLRAALVENLLRLTVEHVVRLSVEVSALSRHAEHAPAGRVRALG